VKTEKISIRVEPRLLRILDQGATTTDMTRSGYIRALVVKQLQFEAEVHKIITPEI
jgi:hypothetical protein